MKRLEDYNIKANKVIIVDCQQKKIFLYEKKGVWNLVKTFDEMYIGKNGLTENKKEGDLCTPIGIFNVGFAFGIDDIKIDYPYYKIKENVYFVDDESSEFYNEWVEVTNENCNYPYSYMRSNKMVIWNSAEHLLDYSPQYDLGLVIEYNMNPIKKGRGSAVFMHVKNNKYTHGCIATSKENMRFILKWFNKDDKVQIIIE